MIKEGASLENQGLTRLANVVSTVVAKWLGVGSAGAIGGGVGGGVGGGIAAVIMANSKKAQ